MGLLFLFPSGLQPRTEDLAPSLQNDEIIGGGGTDSQPKMKEGKKGHSKTSR